MFLALVTGHVVATQKVAAMAGKKLLVVEPLRVAGPGGGLEGTGRTLVAVDSLGSGAGQIVLICQGSSARLTDETTDLPIDAVVIGIVDSVRIGDRAVVESGRNRA
jgi:ethanolamine utilization protein EutN